MRVSNLAQKEEYGIITVEILDEIFSQRMMAADLLSIDRDDRTAHAAKTVRFTLESLYSDFASLIM